MDLNDKDATSQFLELVTQSDEFQDMISPMPENWKPKLSVSSILQKHILFLLNAWYTKNVTSLVVDITEGLEVDKWLQANRPTLVFYSVHTGKEIFTDDEEYHQGYQNLDLKEFLIEEIITAMTDGKKINKCVECERYFLPTPRGRNQIYCTSKCQHRVYMRENARKKRENL